MEGRELAHIIAAVLIFFVISVLGFVLQGEVRFIPQIFVFAVIVVVLPVIIKKAAAYSLDSAVEHSVWTVDRYWIKPGMHFSKPIPAGIIFPLFFSVFSLGVMQFGALLTYEAKALKHRAAKRFGYYSYTMMTEWHHALIGASGIVCILIISLLAYLADFEVLTKMAAYYAIVNMLPISKLDGTQIFFGSRVLWSVLAFVSAVFAFFAFVL